MAAGGPVEAKDRSPVIIVAKALEVVAGKDTLDFGEGGKLIAKAADLRAWQAHLRGEHLARWRYIDNGRHLPPDLADSSLDAPDKAAVLVHRYTTSPHFGPLLADQREPILTAEGTSDRAVGLVLEELGILEPVKRGRPGPNWRTRLVKRIKAIAPGTSITSLGQKIQGAEWAEVTNATGEYYKVSGGEGQVKVEAGLKNPGLLTDLVSLETTFLLGRSGVPGGIQLRMRVGQVNHNRPDQVAAYRSLITL